MEEIIYNEGNISKVNVQVSRRVHWSSVNRLHPAIYRENVTSDKFTKFKRNKFRTASIPYAIMTENINGKMISLQTPWSSTKPSMHWQVNPPLPLASHTAFGSRQAVGPGGKHGSPRPDALPKHTIHIFFVLSNYDPKDMNHFSLSWFLLVKKCWKAFIPRL